MLNDSGWSIINNAAHSTIMFKFTLQALLNYRKRIEDKRQKELALKNRLLFEEKKRLDDYTNDILQHEKNFAFKQKMGMDINELKSYFTYFERLKNLCDIQNNRILKASKDAEAKRGKLLSAIRDRRTLDILRKREYKKYLDEIKYKEQKLTDEIAVIRHGRTCQCK